MKGSSASWLSLDPTVDRVLSDPCFYSQSSTCFWMADFLLSRLFGGPGGAQPELPGASEEEQQQWDEEQEGEEAWEEEGSEGDVAGGVGSGGVGGKLEMDVSSGEVLRRIRSATLWFVSELCEGRLPDIDMVSREAGNRVLQADGGRVGGGDVDEGSGGGGGEQYVLRLQQQTQRRSLLGRHPESAEQVARLWVLLGLAHQLLLQGEQATQREIWYQVKVQEVRCVGVGVWGAGRRLLVGAKAPWPQLTAPFNQGTAD